MKIYAIILMLIFFFASSAFAGNGETLFRKKVSNKIAYPEQVSEKVETEVFVEFTVKNSGEIVIDSISSENEEINAAIADQIRQLDVKPTDTDVIGKTFRYRFVLKVQ